MSTEIPVQQLVHVPFNPVRFAKVLREIADKVEACELVYIGGSFFADVDEAERSVVFNSTLKFR